MVWRVGHAALDAVAAWALVIKLRAGCALVTPFASTIAAIARLANVASSAAGPVDVNQWHLSH